MGERAFLFDDENALNNKLDFIIKNRIGNGAYISNEVSNNNNKILILGISVPLLIDDSKSGNRLLKFMKFDSIGMIEVNKSERGIKLSLPNNDDLENHLMNKLQSLIFNVEYSLFRNTYEKLIEIPSVQNSLNPLREILVRICEEGKLDIDELTKYREKRKILRYISLLKDLELVKVDGNNLISGNKFNVIEKKLEREEAKVFYSKIMAYVLGQSFSYMREYLKLTSITPYVRWCTSYYLPSVNAHEILYLDKDDMIRNYFSFYEKKMIKTKAYGQINRLLDVGILQKDDNYIYGNDKIMSSLSGVVSKLI